jgi:hypothetical protein
MNSILFSFFLYHLVKVSVSVFQSLASIVFTFDFLTSQPVEYMTNVVGAVIILKQGNVSTSNKNAIIFATPSWLYGDYNFCQ